VFYVLRLEGWRGEKTQRFSLFRSNVSKMIGTDLRSL
jgi:hypothetical protein